MDRQRLLFLLLIVALAWTGCAETDTGNEKGAEDEALSDAGKADSFYRPTEHGALNFGIPSQGEMTKDDHFHSWTFELTDVADFSIKTQVSKNLDTVLYLYYRTDANSSWGKYISKNDDFEGNIWSQISKKGQAGQYRIIVKPFKSALQGTFSVEATCTGAGCGAPNTTCEPTSTDFTSPSETGFAASCAGDMRDILSTPVTGEDSFAILLEKRCELAAPARKAAELYYDYWNGLIGWEDFVYGDGTMYITVKKHGDAGTLVDINVGGDEDTVLFLFDAQDELVMYYHDEQSPSAYFFCKDAAETDAAEPDYDCLIQGLYNTPHSFADETQTKGQTSPANAEADLGPRGKYAMDAFVAAEGLGVDDAVDFTMSSWGADYGGALVTFTVGATTATYDVVQSSNQFLVTLRTDEKGTQFVCTETYR